MAMLCTVIGILIVTVTSYSSDIFTGMGPTTSDA